MKKLLSLLFLFTVRVNVPWGEKQTYLHVRHVTPLSSGCYELILEDGKKVWVPTAFTVVEEN